MLSPEESRLPAILSELDRPVLPEAGGLSAFELAVIDPWRNALHRQLARTRSDRGGRGELREALVQHCNADGVQALQREHRTWLAQDAFALARLHEVAWAADAPACWKKSINRLCQIAADSPALRP
jgi:membrane glycosyltransferase